VCVVARVPHRVLRASDVFRPWFNGYRYLVQMATAFSERRRAPFVVVDVSKCT
jgi:hypothetical protein